MIGELPEGPGAYRWWYVDGLSADGQTALVVIFFWGAVFSPYYARRLARGERPHPREHVGVHCVLYRGGRRVGWLLSERRGEFALAEAGERVEIGRSWLAVRGPQVTLHLDDAHLGPLRGELSLTALEPPLAQGPLALAPGGLGAVHQWFPRVPRGRLEAQFSAPRLAFKGLGYHDTNWGPEPLGSTLLGWHWSRRHSDELAGGTEISYRVQDRQGARFVHRLVTGQAPRCTGGPAEGRLQRSSWGIALPDTGPVIESTPFYARYFLPKTAMSQGLGETLDLRRLDSRLVRHLLRYRTWRHSSPAETAAESG